MSREEIIAANPIADFVRSRGHELKAAGENFVTSGCPVKQHKKYHRPNTIDPAKNLWHCNDCGGGGTVIDWLSKEKRIPIADAMRELGGGKNDSEPVAMYDYTDEHDELLYQVCRFDPKDFRARRGPDDPQCKLGIKGVRRVLYRLPEVIKAQLVCIAEGEKNADDLSKLGFVATTNVFGAGKWRDEYNEFLLGKDVVVFGDVGDADRTGEKHTEQVIASLSLSGISPRHALQPDGFHDVSDYIASLPANTAARAIAKLIDEAKFAPTTGVEAQSRNGEPVELPAAPPPYTPPPLDLLPSVLQDYVQAAAKSLNVDVSFILLPLLSALGSAIGNARSILLKDNFVQPPVIWTGIVGRSGSRKSPSLNTACLAVMEHERELVRQNKEALEIFQEDMASWQQTKKNHPGTKTPKQPDTLTCVMDDLTSETLAKILSTNPRGVLIRKDELSHWFAAMDQYHDAKGIDVTRWLSFHTGFFSAVDRKTHQESFRLWHPRVCIAGGIQPTILARVLTPDYFERGLPARFLLAAPPGRKDQWSENTISSKLTAALLEVFKTLYELEPERENEKTHPQLLCLDPDAKAIFVRYYNACGDAAIEGDERAEASWSKLSGYAARLALVGQLVRDSNSKLVTSEVMQSACDLAKWFGDEAIRIYATFTETPEQRSQRRLIEFIESRGESVTERDVYTNYWPFKNQREKAEAELNSLVKVGYGKWEEIKPEGRGRPTRIFRKLSASASAQFLISPSKSPNCADADSPNSQKNEGASRPRTPPETLAVDESGVVRL